MDEIDDVLEEEKEKEKEEDKDKKEEQKKISNEKEEKKITGNKPNKRSNTINKNNNNNFYKSQNNFNKNNNNNYNNINIINNNNINDLKKENENKSEIKDDKNLKEQKVKKPVSQNKKPKISKIKVGNPGTSIENNYKPQENSENKKIDLNNANDTTISNSNKKEKMDGIINSLLNSFKKEEEKKKIIEETTKTISEKKQAFLKQDIWKQNKKNGVYSDKEIIPEEKDIDNYLNDNLQFKTQILAQQAKINTIEDIKKSLNHNLKKNRPNIPQKIIKIILIILSSKK